MTRGNWLNVLLGVLCLSLLFASANSQTAAVTASGDTFYLHNDGTYQKTEKSQKEDKRLKSTIENLGKKHSASDREIAEAYSMAVQGWRYSLPQPKSPQAAWGNRDGRTTWWYGYWRNTQSGKHSSIKPQLSKAGIWIGDDQNLAGYYRRGGSPTYPSKIELILSDL